MTVSFGHGIAVSPLHLVNGVATVLNGGIRWPVTLLKRSPFSDHRDGTSILDPDTSEKMRKVLRLIVTEGTGGKAAATGYLVGGKTGTAEKPSSSGYVKNSLMSSFIGAFPMHEPRYVVLVMVDEPKGNKRSHGYATGGWVAAPAVREVIARSAPLLGVDPVDPEAPEIQQVLSHQLKPMTEEPHLASF